jgi:hypothetical protein
MLTIGLVSELHLERCGRPAGIDSAGGAAGGRDHDRERGDALPATPDVDEPEVMPEDVGEPAIEA